MQSPQRPRRSWLSGENYLLWILPMIFFLVLFYLYPLLDVIRLSFTDASLIRGDYEYTLQSYSRLIRDPRTFHSLRITVIFALSNVVFQLIFGLLLALIFQAGEERRLPGTTIVRTVVLAAWIIPGVITGILWRTLLTSANYGVINYFIRSMGGETIPFLINPDYALLSVIVVNIWHGTAFSMLLQYAGLQRIPHELYEAARVDGASVLQSFRFITLPLLRPVLFINLVLISIYTFNAFDMILALTGGGPARMTEVLTINTHTQVFQFFQLGRGAGMAVTLLLINLVMTLVYFRAIEFEGD
jgi:multiple sugar transport system permease protein